MKKEIKVSFLSLLLFSLILSLYADFEIISAEYGADESWMDVTKVLREKVKSDTLVLEVGNGIAGDPNFGVSKFLRIEYIFNGETRNEVYREGEFIVLPPRKRNDNEPPQIIEFDPPAHSNNIDASRDTISITFDRPMFEGHSWEFVGKTPEIEHIKWITNRTCEAKVVLDPFTEYRIWLNKDEKNSKFRSFNGLPLERTFWTFDTGDDLTEEHIWQSLDMLDNALKFMEKATTDSERIMAMDAAKQSSKDLEKNFKKILNRNSESRSKKHNFKNNKNEKSSYTYDPTNGTISCSGGIWRVKQ